MQTRRDFLKLAAMLSGAAGLSGFVLTLFSANLRVHLRNAGAGPLTVLVADDSYKTDTVSKNIKPGHEESVLLHLTHTHGWYDFTVKAQDAGGAEARYTGRVETGKSSFSDPLMGFVLL